MIASEISVLISIVASALYECLDSRQIELMAVVFTQLGDTLATMSVIDGISSKDD